MCSGEWVFGRCLSVLSALLFFSQEWNDSRHTQLKLETTDDILLTITVTNTFMIHMQQVTQVMIRVHISVTTYSVSYPSQCHVPALKNILNSNHCVSDD